jgi:hypothetical protein
MGCLVGNRFQRFDLSSLGQRIACGHGPGQGRVRQRAG